MATEEKDPNQAAREAELALREAEVARREQALEEEAEGLERKRKNLLTERKENMYEKFYAKTKISVRVLNVIIALAIVALGVVLVLGIMN